APTACNATSAPTTTWTLSRDAAAVRPSATGRSSGRPAKLQAGQSVSEKRAKRSISGWIILDKPLGMSSTQAVGKVRWLYNAEKAGHAGTLDPLATGLLPIALGEATKTVPLVQRGG